MMFVAAMPGLMDIVMGRAMAPVPATGLAAVADSSSHGVNCSFPDGR